MNNSHLVYELEKQTRANEEKGTNKLHDLSVICDLEKQARFNDDNSKKRNLFWKILLNDCERFRLLYGDSQWINAKIKSTKEKLQ